LYIVECVVYIQTFGCNLIVFYTHYNFSTLGHVKQKTPVHTDLNSQKTELYNQLFSKTDGEDSDNDCTLTKSDDKNLDSAPDTEDDDMELSGKW
jgi:hypothetical protein